MTSINIQLFGGRGSRSKIGIVGKGFAEGLSNNSSTKEINCNRFSTLKEWEANIRGLKQEVLVVFKNGKPIKAYLGENSAVEPPNYEYSKWQGCVVTHNHPNNGTFSKDDLLMIANYEYAEIRAVVKDGVFVFRRKIAEPDYDGLASDINKKYYTLRLKVEVKLNKIVKRIENLDKAKLEKLTFQLILSEHNKFYKKLAENNGFEYLKLK